MAKPNRKRMLDEDLEDTSDVLRTRQIDFDVDGDDTPPADASMQPTPTPIEKPSAGVGGQMFFISFGSGSSGNCAYLGDSYSGLLIDAGVDPEGVFRVLAHHGIRPAMVKGIILTHDHQDHVRYVYKIIKRHRHIQVYCTPRLMQGLLRRHNISRRVKDYHKSIFKEIPFHLAGMELTAFETMHDGTDNMGFSIVNQEGTRFVVATDMGEITERAMCYMEQANYLMIESNYDRQMLDQGRYPEMLKHRVRGATGHLDNAVCANFVASHYHQGLRYVFLCHLSNDNNTPDKALTAVRSALEQRGLSVGDASNSVAHRNRDVQLYALPRYDASPLFVLQ